MQDCVRFSALPALGALTIFLRQFNRWKWHLVLTSVPRSAGDDEFYTGVTSHLYFCFSTLPLSFPPGCSSSLPRLLTPSTQRVRCVMADVSVANVSPSWSFYVNIYFEQKKICCCCQSSQIYFVCLLVSTPPRSYKYPFVFSSYCLISFFTSNLLIHCCLYMIYGVR